MKISFFGKTSVNSINCSYHCHDIIEIIVHNTEAESVVDGKCFHVMPGSIEIVPPNIKHHVISDEYYEDYAIRFEDSQGLFSNIEVLYDASKDIVSLVEILFKNYTQKRINYKSISETLLDVICDYIIQIRGENYHFPISRTIRDILTDNIPNKKFIFRDAMKKLNVNVDYARRCFTRDMGVSPIEFLTNMRINMAKKLLARDVNSTIYEISDLCGFSDPYYFSRCFKKFMKVSPREYRNSHMLQK